MISSPKLLDVTMLANHVEKYQKDNGLNGPSRAFIYFFLSQVHGLTNDQVEEIVTDGPDDRGVDAIFISESDNQSIIKIYQFKYHSSDNMLEKNFPSSEVDKTLTFIQDLFSKEESLERSCNAVLWDNVQRIWEIYEDRRVSIEINFVSNGERLLDKHRERLLNSLRDFPMVNFREYAFDDILLLLISRPRSKRTHKIKVVDDQIFSRLDGIIKGAVATISAEDLVKTVSIDDGFSAIDSSLFEENVRSYLGNDNPVNESIIKSSLSEDNYLFWYLNNGITIVCDSFYYNSAVKRSPILNIENMQIVNGAQTLHALFEAYKINPDIIGNVLVLVKFYETKEYQMYRKIALATNSQSRIFVRDLMSNHQIHLKIESIFESFGYFYERKRNQYSGMPSSRRIDALKMGQIILSYKLKFPEKARSESDKIFGSLHDDIFSQKLTPDDLLFMYNLSIKIEGIRENINQQIKKGLGSFVNGLDCRFILYGQYHLMYIIALMREKNSVFASTEIDDLIQLSIKTLSDVVAKKSELSLYNFFRSPRGREAVSDAVNMQLFGMKKEGQLPLPF
jgi:hypothetical protein